MTPRLRARSLERSFRIGGSQIPVLRGIDLDIVAGESVFLCGASGAGKTTLLYTLAGLETPESGTVEFEGQSLYSLSGNALARLRNQHMGFVFQSYFLLPELTALENVLLPSMIGGKNTESRAKELLDRVGLKDRMDHLPAELSGGGTDHFAGLGVLGHGGDHIGGAGGDFPQFFEVQTQAGAFLEFLIGHAALWQGRSCSFKAGIKGRFSLTDMDHVAQ